MGKIFLSHSSKDKPYVSYIADHLGKDRCVYDELCFEAGMKNLDEILRGMDNSSIFVIFLSNNSLESDWVKRELAIAAKKIQYSDPVLQQLFPIIIDPTIKHTDPRIPDFLKTGFDSYNLRVIESNVVAYRKIKAQQRKMLLSTSISYQNQQKVFYGRNQEISYFTNFFETDDGIRCLVASGITGIGRRSYLLACMKTSGIIEAYYEPPVVSLASCDSIEDLIVKLSEVGFARYSISDVTSLSTMDEKISLLSQELHTIQDYNEQVVIYDDACLIDRHGEFVYWFERSLEQIRPEVTVVIASRYDMSQQYTRKHKWVFSCSIMPLRAPEWKGLMRVYGKTIGVGLTQEDRDYFNDILTGYPPQILFCVEEMRDRTVEAVKKHPESIVHNYSERISEILSTAISDEIKDDAYGLLAFLCSYGIVPSELLDSVLCIKKNYSDLFILFRRLTFCRYIGVYDEYVEINPTICDYIQRSHFKRAKDIDDLLNQKLEEFNKKINDGMAMENDLCAEDFEDIKIYLKMNIMNGSDIPDRFMYSTVYLSSINELYNQQKYRKVINLISKLKEIRAFDRYDKPVQIQIQKLFCRALARERETTKFYTEVEFFTLSDVAEMNEYNFLRGFMYRHQCKYDMALVSYKRVLKANPNHRSAMREIVIVYRGLGDYENAFEYAKTNYLREKENVYQIQPFFEVLVRKKDCTEEEQKYIQEMLRTIKMINSYKPSTTYYEMYAEYATYVEKDEDRASSFLSEGKRKFADSSYMIRVEFDCWEYFRNVNKMEEAISQLRALSEKNQATRIVYEIRQALLYAYQHKPRDFIESSINGISGINDETKNRLQDKAEDILNYS